MRLDISNIIARNFQRSDTDIGQPRFREPDSRWGPAIASVLISKPMADARAWALVSVPLKQYLANPTLLLFHFTEKSASPPRRHPGGELVAQDEVWDWACHRPSHQQVVGRVLWSRTS